MSAVFFPPLSAVKYILDYASSEASNAYYLAPSTVRETAWCGQALTGPCWRLQWSDTTKVIRGCPACFHTGWSFVCALRETHTCLCFVKTASSLMKFSSATLRCGKVLNVCHTQLSSKKMLWLSFFFLLWILLFLRVSFFFFLLIQYIINYYPQ